MEMILFAGLGLLAGIFVNWLADYLIAKSELPNVRSRLRAPIIVIVSALAFAVLWFRFGMSIPLILTALYTIVFLFVLVTDLEHHAIFTIVLLPATILAELASPLSQFGMPRSLLGGGIAFVIVAGIYWMGGLMARLLRIQVRGGGSAFGRGDVYLATFVGFVVAFPAVFSAIIYTILLGGVGAIATLIYQRAKQGQYLSGTAIAYGPFFCIAGWAMMVIGS